jgi:hypothetical protein
MSAQGLGLGFSVLVCGLLAGGLPGCLTAEAGAKPNEAQPREVVQHIAPAHDRSSSAASGPSASNASRTAPDVAPVTQKRLAEPITSKHLEAELNRLEAELGR